MDVCHCLVRSIEIRIATAEKTCSAEGGAPGSRSPDAVEHLLAIEAGQVLVVDAFMCEVEAACAADCVCGAQSSAGHYLDSIGVRGALRHGLENEDDEPSSRRGPRGGARRRASQGGAHELRVFGHSHGRNMAQKRSGVFPVTPGSDGWSQGSSGVVAGEGAGWLAGVPRWRAGGGPLPFPRRCPRGGGIGLGPCASPSCEVGGCARRFRALGGADNVLPARSVAETDVGVAWPTDWLAPA